MVYICDVVTLGSLHPLVIDHSKEFVLSLLQRVACLRVDGEDITADLKVHRAGDLLHHLPTQPGLSVVHHTLQMKNENGRQLLKVTLPGRFSFLFGNRAGVTFNHLGSKVLPEGVLYAVDRVGLDTWVYNIYIQGE